MAYVSVLKGVSVRIRFFATAFVFMALAVFAAPQADARNLGGFSLDRSGPKPPSPSEGGFYICIAHLRFLDVSTGLWSYHTAIDQSPSLDKRPEFCWLC